MLLPESFVFTQQNLQDYVDCTYRFYLREIKRLEWPAVDSEPIREQEELMQLGNRFHLLCQQYFSGIPAEVLCAQIVQPELVAWWQNFLSLKLMPSSGDYLVEKLVSFPFCGYRLAAKFDLLIKDFEGKTLIYDWKTSQHQPKRQTLLQKMQSKVYPLVAFETSSSKVVQPESIEMVYWYPAFPASPIKFAYSRSKLEADRSELEHLITEIAQKDEDAFSKTDDEKKCQFCRYRSLCNRGDSAGINDELEDLRDMDDVFNFDFDAV